MELQKNVKNVCDLQSCVCWSYILLTFFVYVKSKGIILCYKRGIFFNAKLIVEEACYYVFLSSY